MADGMCGPSNALQNFQKHSTVDRTLQQDRLISRQSPSQGFRSSGPNAGLLDHEFESFQAGQLPLDHSFQPNTFQHAPPGMQQQGPPNWAADFQRMNISSPAPQLPQQPFGMHAQQRQDTASWHQDFARQQMAERSMQASSHVASSFQPRMLGMSSQFTGYNTQQPQLSIAQQKQPEEAFDEAAFERAFEEAARAAAESESIQEPTQHESVGLGQDLMLDESAEALVASDDLQERSDELLSQERIGSDTIHDPLFDAQDQPQNDDPEELARTAAKLLDSVQYEQNSKFQNSQFLSLMRQFRDREKTVQGDHVVTKNRMGEINQNMNDERYQERIVSICDALEHLALDPKHPFKVTPVIVRELIRLLLSLNALNIKQLPIDNPTFGQLAKYSIINRVSIILQNLLLQPWINDLYTCFSLAFFTLNSYPSGREGFDTTPEPPKVIDLHLISEYPVQDVLETYVSSLRSGNPNALLDVLPYQIPPGEENMDVHIKNVKEILGKYVDIGETCKMLRVWSEDIPVDKLVGFMGMYLEGRNMMEESLQLKMDAFHNQIRRV